MGPAHLHRPVREEYEMSLKINDMNKASDTPISLIQARKCAQSGFALVIALSLMAFVVLLLLTISSLIRVEEKSQETTLNSMRAEQNAILGIHVALGELQRQTGPDTRVSARAEILDGDPTTDDVLEGVQQAHWTGTWRLPESADSSSFPEGIDPQAAPELVTWLVSGNSGELKYTPLNDDPSPLGLSPISALSEDKRVTLVPAVPARPAVGSLPRPAVEAPLVSTGSGGFAYYVIDEGVQASINAVALTPDATEPPLLPLSNGQSAFPEIDVPSDWAKVIDLSFLISVGGSDEATALSQLDYDATTWSRGLLTDTLRGGLQMDLSTALRLNKSQFSGQVISRLPDGRIYKPYHPIDNGAGPSWDVFRQFGQLESRASSDGYATTVWWPSGAAQDDVQLGLFPVIERFQLHVVVRLSGDLDPDPDTFSFRPRIYYLPAVVLWNPYDQPLVARDGLVLRWRKQGNEGVPEWGYYFAAGHYDASTEWNKIAMGGQDVGKFPRFFTDAQSFIEFNLRGSEGDAEIVIPPGEARVFTMASNDEYVFGSTQTMVQGLNNFGLYQDAEETIEWNDTDLPNIYLDIRTTRLRDFNPGGGNDSPSKLFNHFLLRDTSGEELLRLYEVRWKAGDFSLRGTDLTGAETVSEVSGAHFFGDDTLGAQPFQPIPGNLPDASTPVYSDGTDTIAAAYELGLKTPSPRIAGTYPNLLDGETLLQRSNLRAPSVSTQPPTGLPPGYFFRNRMYSSETLVENLNIAQNAQDNFVIEPWGNNNDATYVGYSDTSSGQPAVSLFHLPEMGEELLSLGRLRHLDLRGVDPSVFDKNGNSPTHVTWHSNNFGPSFVIGEAHANSWLSSTTYSDGINVPDYQWIANRQVWDRFFVSTIPDDAAFEFPLANGKLRLAQGALDAGKRQRLADFRTAGSELLIKGAFNVNSTSVRSWEALFSQYFGREVAATSNADTSPFIDLPDPIGGAYESGGTAGGNAFTGFRRLNRDEIKSLAKAMVEEVKRRGPFLSLADFVNRSVRDNPATNVFSDQGGELNGSLPTLAELAEDPRIFGALQAAIEKAELNIDFEDQFFFDDLSKAPLSDDRFYGFRAAAIGALAEGAPGYLTQGKLLQRLGPILRPRSDSFTVRAYGEYRNPLTDVVEGRRYCEAVIQRTYEYVDRVDAPEELPSEVTAAVNQSFGRQFNIVAFRWLTPPENP